MNTPGDRPQAAEKSSKKAQGFQATERIEAPAGGHPGRGPMAGMVGQKANDFTVFVPWASEYPADRGDRDLWTARLRARAFQPEGLPAYTRLWFGDEAEQQDPVTLWEDVYYDREGDRPDRRLFQTTMLFHRDLAGGDGRELLLALTLEPEDSKDVSHEMMIGLPLSVGEFRA